MPSESLCYGNEDTGTRRSFFFLNRFAFAQMTWKWKDKSLFSYKNQSPDESKARKHELCNLLFFDGLVKDFIQDRGVKLRRLLNVNHLTTSEQAAAEAVASQLAGRSSFVPAFQKKGSLRRKIVHTFQKF